jgi:orotate phosphoribosyltransferase
MEDKIKLEGFAKRTNVVVIEDLISDNSLQEALEALKEAGATVKGILAIFSQFLMLPQKILKKANVDLHTLSNYELYWNYLLQKNI